MDPTPRPPRKRSRLMLIIGGIILFIVVVTFVGMNLSHLSELKGGQG